MPLSQAVDRQHIHTRTIQCQGFRRADGLWDVDAHLTDVKTYGIDNIDRGRVEAGDPVHEMWIRLTLTNEFEIIAIEAVTDKSPFRICPSIAGNFQRLVGLRIVAGFTKAVRDRLGGVEGCTHLVELMGPVATTAFQTIYPLLAHDNTTKEAVPGPAPTPGRKPALLNSCHAFGETSSVVARLWPNFHRPTHPENTS